MQDSLQCTEVLEVLLETIQFGLGEQLTLGFLPYYPHRGIDNSTSEDDVSVPLEHTENGNTPIWPDDTMRDDWGQRYLEVLRGTGARGKKFETDYNLRIKALDLLTEETESLYNSMGSFLHCFSVCVHDGTLANMFPCSKCSDMLGDKGKEVNQQNATI